MKLTRRRLAAYVADGLSSDRQHRLQIAAAWLIDNHRTKDVALLSRDIASILALSGYVSATATSAKPLPPAIKSELETYIRRTTSARSVELATTVDPTVGGGIKLTLPDAELDATTSTKLRAFVTEMSL
ncbi:F0F1 ATP synthase subunit delta [Candidatus Saccharibacteria bacterium]|nr:F0F1 ATP synthase subunit delta [Candidatus Saccharibacteria bacterium]